MIVAIFRSSLALLVLLAQLSLFGIVAVGVAVSGSEDLSAQPAISAQVTPLEEEGEDAPGLGVIVGTPEAGPEPEDAGDRGGFAQLGLAIVLFAAIGFMASRVIKGARAGA